MFKVDEQEVVKVWEVLIKLKRGENQTLDWGWGGDPSLHSVKSVPFCRRLYM